MMRTAIFCNTISLDVLTFALGAALTVYFRMTGDGRIVDNITVTFLNVNLSTLYHPLLIA